MLAFALGLRHACDADHIAAIDNVTRRLALLGRESLFVGGYFALGHSTIVCLMCIAVAISSSVASSWLSSASDVASIIGTAVSLLFLLVRCLHKQNSHFVTLSVHTHKNQNTRVTPFFFAADWHCQYLDSRQTRATLARRQRRINVVVIVDDGIATTTTTTAAAAAARTQSTRCCDQ